jgi:hypothetical protein
MDTILTTPTFSLADPSYTAAQLQYKTDFEDYQNQDDGYVDISTNGGSNWTNLIHYAKADYPGPKTETVDLSPFLGNANVQIRFRYVATGWDWDWQVDDVVITSSNTCTPPAITSQPADQAIAGGATATLSVTATGTAALSYQWYQGASGDTSNPMGGAVQPSFTTPVLTTTTTYWVRVSNNCGQADSRTATVTVNPMTPPGISSLRKLGAPFRIKVLGGNLQYGIRVFINGTEWTNLKWKNTGKVKLKGGAALKALVPKNTPTQFQFVNPDGGQVTVVWQWP